MDEHSRRLGPCKPTATDPASAAPTGVAAGVLAQIIVDKDSGIEAFEDYMKIAFPFLEGRKKAKATEAHDALRSWIAEGPLKVTPQFTPKRSRLKERVMARMATREQAEKHSKVVKQWQQRT